jgi:hypothetical protein
MNSPTDRSELRLGSAGASADPTIQLLSFAGKRRVAVVSGSGRRLSVAAVRRLQAPSLKGRLIRESTARFVMVGGVKLLSTRKLSDLWPGGSDDCLEWLSRLDAAGIRADQLAIVWSKSRTVTRLYIHLLHGSGSPAAFGKVFFGADAARCQITEATALDVLAGRGHRSFGVPPLQGRFSTSRSHTLVFDALPTNARAVRPNERAHPEAVVRELQSSQTWHHVAALRRQPWWGRTGSLGDAVAAFLVETGDDLGHACGFAHGDVSPANLLVSGARLWLVDWEESGAVVPRGTDRLGAYFSFCGPATRRLRLRALSRKLRARDGAEPQRRAELLLALLYRHAHGHPEATLLLSDWRKA